MTGIPRKNENSAAAPLEHPSTMAPRMVEPEREVPGIRARSWTIPIKKRGLGGNLSYLVKPWIGANAAVLQDNEKHAIYYQGSGHHIRIKEMGFHPVIQQKSQDSCRDAGNDNLNPQGPGCIPLPAALTWA